MRAYGLRPCQFRDEEFGPQTKHAPNIRSKNRRTSRRLLHKQGRNDAKRDLATRTSN